MNFNFTAIIEGTASPHAPDVNHFVFVNLSFFTFRNSFSTSCKDNSAILNLSLTIYFSWIARILSKFLYVKVAVQGWSPILSMRQLNCLMLMSLQRFKTKYQTFLLPWFRLCLFLKSGFANQLTGFYIMATLAFNELILSLPVNLLDTKCFTTFLTETFSCSFSNLYF